MTEPEAYVITDQEIAEALGRAFLMALAVVATVVGVVRHLWRRS
jgi:hypothetical protein